MTFVHRIPSDGPATHALLIGVGGYDHLDGGRRKRLPNPSEFGGLGQLTSPPRSAIAVARFLAASKKANWRAPLASVDLLVSPAPSDPEVVADGGPYGRATLDAIKAAFNAWWRRCKPRPPAGRWMGWSAS